MGILFLYQMGELVVPLTVAISGLALLMLSGIVLELGNFILVKKISADIVIALLMHKIPGIIVAILPVAVLFATMFTIGRLAKDREIIVMRIAGLSCLQIMAPYLAVALLMSGAAYAINEHVTPWSNHQAEALTRRIIYESPPPELTENVVFRDKNRFIYIGKVDPVIGHLDNIIVYEIQDGQAVRAVMAKEGQYTENRWLLSSGVMHEFSSNGLISREMNFAELKINVEIGDFGNYRRQRSGTEMSRQELADLIVFLRERSVDTASFEVDYHLKSALPLTPFAFVIMGIPFMIGARSHQRLYSVIVSIAIALLYFIAISFFSAAGRGKALSPLWAAWIPNGIAFFIGTVLTCWEDRR